MLNRRTLIAAACGGLLGLGGWRFFRGHDDEAILMVLRKRLGYLRLDEAGMRAFATDLASRKLVSSGKLRLMVTLGPLYRRINLNGQDSITASIHHGEERIITNYLLSSDFFINGADESRTVRYLGFYDPLHACSNPFARPVGGPA
jgi:hypothetical protein